MSSLSDHQHSSSSDLSLTLSLDPCNEPKFRNTSQSCDEKGRAQGKSYRHANETTINMLPEDVLLEIFDFCGRNEMYHGTNPHNIRLNVRHHTHEAWHTLVHVCQRWRQIIFSSPRRLALKLLCKNGTPVRKNLDYFPALLIVIRYRNSFTPSPYDKDNLSAALDHPDRIFYINISASNSQLKEMAAVMLESFPVLTVLQLMAIDRVFWNKNSPVLPEGFLGGSAPRLQEISLSEVPFPALPTLLASANDLVVLRLENTPEIGYVSPEVMVVCLATLSRLETLHIQFRSPSPLPGRIPLPPDLRAVLPALTNFGFGGICEYLEVLVSRIDSPRLNTITITIWGGDFRVSRLLEFINRTDSLKPILFKRMAISSDECICFSRAAVDDFWDSASICILCERNGWQVSELTHILSQLSAILSYVAHLEISGSGVVTSAWQAMRWLPLLHPFTAVQTLYIHEELSGYISLALEDVTMETVTDVLPALGLLYLGSLNQSVSSIQRLVTFRQNCGRPVTVVEKTEFYTRFQSYLSE